MKPLKGSADREMGAMYRPSFAWLQRGGAFQLCAGYLPTQTAADVGYPSMAGEELHQRGADGIDSAKRWLESTTRAEVRWVVPDAIAVKKLTFKAATGSSYSFDIGGNLRGGRVDQQEFFGEVKNYKDASDQGTLYQEFLAKCYRAYEQLPERCDCFLWISWAPFSATTWSKLDDPDAVKTAVKKNWKYNFSSKEVADSADIDETMTKSVSDRIWRIVLSDYQVEHLSMVPEYRGVIARYEVDRGVSR
ncbi:hypothetical protein [Mycolicibacterium poriferae]|nr:hypothetical protein [Mycolicibacterium poriferae]